MNHQYRTALFVPPEPIVGKGGVRAQRWPALAAIDAVRLRFAVDDAAAALGEGRRIMSLRDGRSKMSKSDPSDQSRINLDDSAEAIQQKIRRAKTDSHAHITYEPEARPEIANLLEIYAGLLASPTAASPSAAEVAVDVAHRRLTMAAFKAELTELAVSRLGPIRRRLELLRQDPAHVEAVLADGAHRARERASQKLRQVHRALGLAAPR